MTDAPQAATRFSGKGALTTDIKDIGPIDGIAFWARTDLANREQTILRRASSSGDADSRLVYRKGSLWIDIHEGEKRSVHMGNFRPGWNEIRLATKTLMEQGDVLWIGGADTIRSTWTGEIAMLRLVADGKEIVFPLGRTNRSLDGHILGCPTPWFRMPHLAPGPGEDPKLQVSSSGSWSFSDPDIAMIRHEVTLDGEASVGWAPHNFNHTFAGDHDYTDAPKWGKDLVLCIEGDGTLTLAEDAHLVLHGSMVLQHCFYGTSHRSLRMCPGSTVTFVTDQPQDVYAIYSGMGTIFEAHGTAAKPCKIECIGPGTARAIFAENKVMNAGVFRWEHLVLQHLGSPDEPEMANIDGGECVHGQPGSWGDNKNCFMRYVSIDDCGPLRLEAYYAGQSIHLDHVTFTRGRQSQNIKFIGKLREQTDVSLAATECYFDRKTCWYPPRHWKMRRCVFEKKPIGDLSLWDEEDCEHLYDQWWSKPKHVPF